MRRTVSILMITVMVLGLAASGAAASQNPQDTKTCQISSGGDKLMVNFVELPAKVADMLEEKNDKINDCVDRDENLLS